MLQGSAHPKAPGMICSSQGSRLLLAKAGPGAQLCPARCGCVHPGDRGDCWHGLEHLAQVRRDCTTAGESEEGANLVCGRAESVPMLAYDFGSCCTVKTETAAMTLKQNFSNASQRNSLSLTQLVFPLHRNQKGKDRKDLLLFDSLQCLLLARPSLDNTRKSCFRKCESLISISGGS